MLPTVADLLSLDVIRRGSPQVVAGSDGLGARVRWVHVLELADAAHLLQGGELVLTTGVALPAEPALLARYAADLRSEEHTSELQSHVNLVCRLLLEKKKQNTPTNNITTQ